MPVSLSRATTPTQKIKIVCNIHQLSQVVNLKLVGKSGPDGRLISLLVRGLSGKQSVDALALN
jgi:hypothetical protein